MAVRSVLLLLLLQSANFGDGLTIDARELKKFEPQVRKAATSRDHHALIKLIDLPLKVNIGPEPIKVRYYWTAQSVERNFDRIFTTKILMAMRTGNYDTGATGSGMISRGDVWFHRPCHAKICNPEGPGPFRIFVINQ